MVSATVAKESQTGGILMAAPTRVDLSAGPRAVVSTAAGLLYKVGTSVLGAERVPTARANAWAAVCADRERAKARAEIDAVFSRGALPRLRP
jgi:hypothetical protein